eukprot:g5699.t1
MHITAEMAPIAKVGGLADVVTGLSRASLARGHTVEVCLPYYQCLSANEIQSLEKDCEFDCPFGSFYDGQFTLTSLRTQIWKGKIAGVPVFLIRPDWSQSNLFKADRIYGGGYNETEAYLYFSRACLEFLRITDRHPNILHLHEWQTAAVALLYWEKYHHDTMSLPRVVFTIHNLDSSGECRQEEFGITGISGEVFASIDKALDERTIGHNPERLSLVKGALIYANAITTVSPTYAKEVLEGGAGGWLRGTLGRSEIRSKVHGILNGIDVGHWDPEMDPYLPKSFSSSSPGGKELCKEYLQRGLGLNVDMERPLVSCVTRLVPQKGIHLIRHGVYLTNELNGQFVLLGTGHADGDFRGMAEQEFKDHANVKLLLLYSEALAHLIYAASDIVLVPSMFEPCGLTQMIAMRYGALPVVRQTGGLVDTVKDLGEYHDGNGFSFSGVDGESLSACLKRAIEMYENEPEKWRNVSQRNMELDFSWDSSVQTYLDLYHSISTPMTDSVVYEHTRENFLELYPELRDCIVNDEIHGKPQEFGKEWITKMLDYNVPKGKLNRGMAVFDVVSSIKGKNEITKDDIKNANVVGWCIEWLQAFFLVEDDIMDGAITRRGQPCWYKQPHVGLIACNDGLMIESSIYRILKKFFAEKDYYIQLVELFHESISRTTYGQMLDLITTPREKGDLSRCTIENYFDISTYKTAYYSFYMPIASGLIMAGIKAKSSFKIAEDILIPMGQYFQIQDDYLDCFADPEFLGKIGTDIQDKKCSWLLCKALSQCSPSQTAILMEKYGEQDESSVNEVKSVYKELNLGEQVLGL